MAAVVVVILYCADYRTHYTLITNNQKLLTCGSLFDAAEPEYKKAHFPNLVGTLVNECVVFAKRKPDRVAVAATMLTRSLMYFGA